VGLSPDHLNDGEKKVLDLRPHVWFFYQELGVLIVAIVLGVLGLIFSPWAVLKIVLGVVILAALVWFLAAYARWTTTNFIITTDRLISRKGVLKREGVEIPLERINTVLFNQTLFERIIGSGDLIIESAGELGAQKASDIRRPLNVQNEIYKQMEENENRKFDRVGRRMAVPENPSRTEIAPPNVMPKPAKKKPEQAGSSSESPTVSMSSPSSSRSIPEQIEALAELHKKGVLTAQEFQSKKTELLGRM